MKLSHTISGLQYTCQIALACSETTRTYVFLSRGSFDAGVEVGVSSSTSGGVSV